MLPKDHIIRSVEIYYHAEFQNHLRGLRFFDKEETLICQVGRHDTAFRTIELAENERIVGVKSCTKEPNTAFRTDI